MVLTAEQETEQQFTTRIRAGFAQKNAVLFGCPVVREGVQKLCATGREEISGAQSELLLLEADGSRRLPVKLPRAGEPVLPARYDRLFVLAGLSAVGKPMGECCQRFSLVQQRWGACPAQPLTPQWLARLLLEGYGQLDPVILLNQAEDSVHRAAGRETAALLRRGGIARVMVCSLQLDWMEEC